MVRRFFKRWRGRSATPPTTQQTSPPAPEPAPAPPPASAPGPQPTATVSPDDLANAAIERLAEDEALRGDLTDDGYMPLQSWAVARLQRIAHEATHHPDPQAAMDGYTGQIRAFVKDVVQAAENGDLGDLPDHVQPHVVLKKDAPAIVDALHHLTLTKDADANAQAIAAALTGNAK